MLLLVVGVVLGMMVVLKLVFMVVVVLEGCVCGGASGSGGCEPHGIRLHPEGEPVSSFLIGR